MKFRMHFIALALTAASITSVALAQEGERLPWGALKAGNKDGSIPAWSGGLSAKTFPAGFKADSGSWVDPYAAEKPLYTVSAANVQQYADKLSEGIKALIKRYPDTFKIDVYPTHRSANYSDWVIENTKKNAAGRCKLIDDGNNVDGCFGGFPFPNPKNGAEAIWNFTLGPKGASTWTHGESWYVDANGNKVMSSVVNNRNNNDYYNKNLTPEQFYAQGGLYFANNNVYDGPARLVGEGNLQRKFIGKGSDPDRTWSYSPGQRRVRLSPSASYDFPVATSAGTMLYDEIYSFSGKMDRFDWKLLGSREMLMPSNNYKAFLAKAEDVLQKGHPKMDVIRFELRRVNVVEATRKAGARHVLAKRVFYLEEDIPSSAVIDSFDDAGSVAKVTLNPSAWAYDKQIIYTGGTYYLDLKTGAWYNSSNTTASKGIFFEIDKVDVNSFYSPEGLARRSQR